jgi:uncharacterized protein (DUF2252 family)
MKSASRHANAKARPRPAAELALAETRAQRVEAGKALRGHVPREAHAAWQPSAGRGDPVDVLEASNKGRLPELVPIRYGRMLRSPFTFLRGSAGLMAHDLAGTPSTQIRVQACGDCHLLNFGLFATPERNLVFDINDFDETLPAPWEWDLKRLAVSLAVAARDNRFEVAVAREAAVSCVRSYRERLREYSKKSPLEVWYERLDAPTLIDLAPDEKTRQRRKGFADAARLRVGENLFPKISSAKDGHHRLIDQPPLLTHVQDKRLRSTLEKAIVDYTRSLTDERRVLMARYQLQDFALKVVGIGSVGTRCFIGLFSSVEQHPLLLQFKEARPSVLAPYAGKSRYKNQGQRVVVGQRLMQSSSDIFLGWTAGTKGHHYFVRQLRDMKLSLDVADTSRSQLKLYGSTCGWALARAHAKSGDAALISGYLGKSDVFDRALGDFALAYFDQTERDHAALKAAARTRRVQVLVEEDI